MSESLIQDRIRLALGVMPGLCLFRNNIGMAEQRGHKIRFGVGGPGGSDLIGIYRGRFLAVEIKTAVGRQTEEQRTFEALITRLGGIYVVLRSVDEALRWFAELSAQEQAA